MYLKTLTLRGFKSFASATTLRFEPGITCVVGPNGSGKSNVVDAFSWVMGQQGVKPLRGGKMEDVVFAGTSGRPALGRAEVTLTIDNTDGALPIEYAEVTISRLLFRTGQSEYAINGSQCRLLDVQELLSDTGLGREMHVIVGQGHLDDILNAGPEARRALIEEAAGVLKHRRRKEKALRKLEAMQANMTRLADLTTELGRQLKPLGRQAQLARKAAVIQADLRDARLRLLADDYVTLSAELARDEADETAAAALRAELEAVLMTARLAESDLEAAAQQHAPRLAVAQQTYFALGGLAERLRAVADLASERHKHLSAPPEPARPGRDPDELDREAAELRQQEHALSDRLGSAREQLALSVSARTAAESALAETERKIAADAREAAERAERLARLRGQAGAARSRLAAAQEEAWLASVLASARARAEQAQQQYGELQDHFGGRDEDRAELVAANERAAAAVQAAAAALARLRKAEHEISDRRAGLRARAAALEEAVRRGADASAVLLADGSGFPGVLGPVAELLTVADGASEAIAAALGRSAAAIAVNNIESAAEILGMLRDAEAGRADLLIADGGPGRETGPPGRPARPGRPGPPRAGTGHDQDGQRLRSVVAAIDLVEAPGELAAAVERLLAGVLVVPDLATGLDLVLADPSVAVVTTDGDLLGAHWARGGSADGESLLGLRAAAQQASGQLAAAELAAQRAERQLADAAEEEEHARQVLAQTQAAMQEVDAAAAEISGRLGALAGAARAAQDEAGRLVAAIAAADGSAEKSRNQLAEIEARMAAESGHEGQAADGTGELTGHGSDRTGRPLAGPGTLTDRMSLRHLPCAAHRLAGRAGRHSPARPGRRWPIARPPPGAPRWTPGWRSGPSRSGCARSAVGPTRWRRRPRPSGRPSPGPPSGPGAGPPRRPSPAQWRAAPGWRSDRSSGRCGWPTPSGSRPRSRTRAATRSSRSSGPGSGRHRPSSTRSSIPCTALRYQGPVGGSGSSRSRPRPSRSSPSRSRRWSPSTARTCPCRPATTTSRRLPSTGRCSSAAPTRRSASLTSSAR